MVGIARGIASGLFVPAGQMFSQMQARPEDRSRAVSTFSAMSLIPGFFAQAFAEYVISRGEGYFFFSSCIPIVAAVLIIMLLPHDQETQAQPNTAGYLHLLHDRRLWVPNFASMQSGLCFAFAWTFLVLMLSGTTPVAAFFTPFSIVNLATRFVGLKYLQRLPPQLDVSFGLFAYLIGVVILAVSSKTIAVVLAGCLFGFGNGITMISCVEWSTRLYDTTNKRPVALVNTSFLTGSIIAQQLTGAFLLMIGWSGVLSLFAAIILVVLALVCVQASSSVRTIASPAQ